MEELLKEENKEVQEVITNYFNVNDWLAVPESIRLRYLQMTRNYVNIPESWKVNPMPKPDFMVEKNNESLKILKRLNSNDIEFKPKKLKSTSTIVAKKNPRRNVTKKNYCEEKEPDNDRYVFCDKCGENYLDYCSKCGMLVSLKSDTVPIGTEDRARKTIPKGILDIKPSKIHGLGVFTIKNLKLGVRMGPYEGEITRVNTTNGYAWKLKDGRLIDASDETNSNYLRYVNCARNVSEQNIVAYQYKGNLYYRTSRDILEGEELLVYYGTSFAKNLGIDPKKYFEPTEEENEPEYFSCKYCSVGLSTKGYRDTHEKHCRFDPKRIKPYKPANIFTCKYCNSTLTDKNIWLRHEKRCPKNKDFKRSIQKDEDINRKKYNCHYCEYAAYNESNLRNHIKKLHEKENSEIYNCKYCDFKTYYKHYLDKHKKHHEGNFPFTCTSCIKGFVQKRNFDNHILNYHEDQVNCITSKIHYCKFCSYKTVYSCSLDRHMFTHKKEINKKYLCVKCGYSCNYKMNLKQHLLIHTQLLPYICKDCKKGFIGKHQLDSHILNKHRNNDSLCKSITSKVYHCKLCSKCIQDKNVLTSTENIQHICAKCKFFVIKRNLDSHILNNHKDNDIIKSITSKIHSCNICSYQNINSSNLKKHLKSHSSKSTPS